MTVMTAQPVPRTPLKTAVIQALIYALTILALGIIVLALTRAADDGLRTGLAITAPVLAALGAAGALWRTYQQWKVRGRWQPWQGASWFLLGTFLVLLSSSAPLLIE